MAEIPEHLLKRSAERRKALGLPVPGEEGGEAAAPRRRRRAEARAPPRRPPRRPPPRPRAARRRRRRAPRTRAAIPAHLLERSAPAQGRARRRRRRRRRRPGRGRRGGAATATAHARRRPTVTGPGGHTQRLLTVVKSGSIQQTRAEAQDKVHTWPHLLVVEFAALAHRDRGAHDLLGHRAGAAARPRRRQPDAEPVEGAVVLPRPAGAAHHVPPDGRGRDHPGHGPRSC